MTSYPTPGGVESAIKDAAKKAATADPSLSTDQRIRLELFDRFLSRVFADGADSAWLLKGGTGMLARVPSTRATLDIDLYRSGVALDQSLADLRRLAGIDLGDHFRFVYTGHRNTLGGDEQPYTDGYRVMFDVYLGAQKKGVLAIDLADGVGITAPIATLTPANRLSLPRLVSHPNRLYPVVDQIADKVCATVQSYGPHDRPSSREKDLVDLVVLAVTQEIDGDALITAIATEMRRRRMAPIDRFSLPTTWGARYTQMAKNVRYCADFLTVDRARVLVTALVDPALDGTAIGRTWLPEQLAYQ